MVASAVLFSALSKLASLLCYGKFHDEAAAARALLETQISPVASHNCARDIKAKPGSVSARLKRLEQSLRRLHARTGVLEEYQHALLALERRNFQIAGRPFRHRSQTVLRKVEEYLQQPVRIRNYRGARLGQRPSDRSIHLTPVRLDHDA